MKTFWMFLAAGALVVPACATGADNAEGDGGSGGDGGALVGGQGSTSTTGGAGGMGGAGGASVSSSSSSSASSGTGAGPTNCGNGVLDDDEQCDGGDFGGVTCQSLGLGSGNLVCNQFCGIVAKQCVPKESCDDFQDNDLDSLIDCDDPECVGVPTCVDSCTPPKSTGVPSFPSGDTTGRPAVHSASCNGGSSGSEVIYEITAPTDGNLSVTLDSFGGADFSISIRTACGDDASEVACSNKQSSGSTELVGYTVTAGSTYFIMVDGVDASQKGQFFLNIQIPPPEGTFFDCTDSSDNDADGYLDCDDATACKGTPNCAPGIKNAGEPCFDTTECAASDGDPICLQSFQGYPGGYCSQFCDLAAPDCTGDSVCAQIGLSVDGVCLDGCVGDGDCRPGYNCVDLGLSTKVCQIGPDALCNDYQDNDFDSLTDCEDSTPGEACQTSTACVPGVNPTGTPCTKANDCTANGSDPLCFDQPYWGFTGGYCSEFCDLFADDCSPGSLCLSWAFWPSGAGNCFHTCVSQAQCRPGYFCQDFGLGQNVCTP